MRDMTRYIQALLQRWEREQTLENPGVINQPTFNGIQDGAVYADEPQKPDFVKRDEAGWQSIAVLRSTSNDS